MVGKTQNVIASEYLITLLEYMQNAFNVAPHDLIPTLPLHQSEQDLKKTTLSLAEYTTLLENIANKITIPELVVAIIKDFAITQHGLLGLAIICGLNLRVALKALVRFHRLRTQLIQLDYQEESDKVSLLINTDTLSCAAQQFTLEVTIAAIYKAKCELLGHLCEKDIIHFNFPEQPSHACYQDFYHCNIYFDQPQTCYITSSEEAGIKLKTANQNSFDLLKAQCEKSLSDLQHNKSDIVQKIHLIFNRSQNEFPSLNQCADKLCVSPRTLCRQLQNTGTSYQKILDHERVYRAKELLRHTDLNITEVAQQLYFSDTSHFSKVFKKLTQTTPSQFRSTLANPN